MTSPDDYPLHLIDASHALTIERLNAWLAEVYPAMCERHPDRARRWHVIAGKMLEMIATYHTPELMAANMCQLTAELLLRQGERIPTITPEKDGT